MTNFGEYSELEGLLFLQAIRRIGTDTTGFSETSKALKGDDLIHRRPDYQPDRYDPDALKQWYLETLKDELQNLRSPATSPAKDGRSSPKKRKLSTPQLRSVEDAAQYNHLLPKVASRLYARYREHAIETIRHEEQEYRRLEREIREIEEGKWDVRLQQSNATTRKESKSVSSIQTLLRDDADDDRQSHEAQRNGTSGSQSLVANFSPKKTSTVPISNDATVVNSVNRLLPSPYGAGNGSQAPQQNLSDVRSSGAPGPQHGFVPVQDPTHAVPPLPPPNQSYTVDAHRRSIQQGHSGVGASASPRAAQHPHIPHERSSGSPIILPPPPGMLRSSGSPGGPLDALADMAGQQYRPNSSITSPGQTQIPATPQQHQLNQLPHPQNYGRQYNQYNNQPPYAPPYSPYGQQSMPAYQIPSNPPTQSYQTYNQARHAGPPQHQAYPPPYPPYHPYTPGQPGVQYMPQSPFVPSQGPRPSPYVTPVPMTSNRRRPPFPSPINTSTSSTKWKQTNLPESTMLSPKSPRPGDYSPLSPIATAAFEGVVPTRSFPSADRSPKLTKDPNPAKKGGTRGGRSDRARTNMSRGRGARAGSTTASSRRSQSEISHTDELSTENAANSIYKIKPEPPATPAAVDDNSSMTSTPADESSRKTGRRRRETLRSLEPTDYAGPSGKRKRAIEETPERRVSAEVSTPLNKPNHILASRNFARTSATIMNDIAGHKLASMFAKPLSEREAPGYKDLIYCPQDLKSIKSAISAGSRAVAATTDTPADAGSPSISGLNTKNSATTWVPITSDVTPPKGIVNSSQLEKEICRIFANAVMFNPDSKRGVGPAFRTRSKAHGQTAADESEDVVNEDHDIDEGGSVVRDTREMFEAVEKSVANWRAAERVAEDASFAARARAGRAAEEKQESDEMDELAGAHEMGEGKPEDGGLGSAVKRRRRG
ncbi:hypothetical protein MMC09_003649 [Bachmanniomyces sp. S44760]|nr:hypothetical protein [Bachmanniomyces sp. S44760]